MLKYVWFCDKRNTIKKSKAEAAAAATKNIRKQQKQSSIES